VDAAPPCKQWRFDGYTELVQDNGRKLTFVAFGSKVGEVDATAIPADGGVWRTGKVKNLVIDGSVVKLDFDQPPLLFQPDTSAYGLYTGGVLPDGFAYGITHDVFRPSSASWRTAAPLKCG
jgi:hypothetical protein